VYSKDRTVVGIIEESTPNILYALHDFGSGETWPGSEKCWRNRRTNDAYAFRFQPTANDRTLFSAQGLWSGMSEDILSWWATFSGMT
jgi:hypothetical protein